MKKDQKSPYQIGIEQAWDYYYKDKLTEARALAESLTQKYPEKSGHHYLIGHTFLKEKQRDKAAELFLRSLENQAEKDGYAYYWLGEVYSQSPFIPDDEDESIYIYDSKKAEEYYKLAITAKSFPIHALTRFQYKLKGQEKIDLYEKGIKHFPEMADFYVLLAKEYYNRGLKDLQYTTLTRAEEKGVISSTLYYNLAIYHHGNDDNKKALEYLEKAIEANKDYQYSNYGLYYWMGFVQKKMGMLENAESSFLTSYNLVKQDSDSMFGFLSLMEIYLEQESFEKLGSLVQNFNINREILEIHGRISGGPLELSEHTYDSIEIHDLGELCKHLLKFKPNSEETFIGKIWLLKWFLAAKQGKYQDQLRAIRNAKKYLSSFSFDFLDDLHSASLYDLVNNRTENSSQLESTYRIFLADQSENYGLREHSIYACGQLIDSLFEHKQFDKVIEISEKFNTEQLAKSESLFKLAYSYVERKRPQDGKRKYEDYLRLEGDNSAVLNNLALIYQEEGNHEKAIELYNRGLQLSPKDDHLNRNIQNATKEKTEKDEDIAKQKRLNEQFQSAIVHLRDENQYVLDKLYKFVTDIQLETDFNDWRIPIPKYKFPKLLSSDKQRSDSLVGQWLAKKYITETEERSEYNVVIYQVNPLLEKELIRLETHKIPQKWIDGLVGISINNLETFGYFDIIARIGKCNKKFKPLIERDFNEVVINYLMDNLKSTIVLSGSLVELALTYHLERKKTTVLQIKDSKGNLKNKKLYDCVLFELIGYVEANHMFGQDFVHLSNLSRLYRNFIHPGMELKATLDKPKADICFISTLEIMRRVLSK